MSAIVVMMLKRGRDELCGARGRERDERQQLFEVRSMMDRERNFDRRIADEAVRRLDQPVEHR